MALPAILWHRLSTTLSLPAMYHCMPPPPPTAAVLVLFPLYPTILARWPPFLYHFFTVRRRINCISSSSFFFLADHLVGHDVVCVCIVETLYWDSTSNTAEKLNLFLFFVTRFISRHCSLDINFFSVIVTFITLADDASITLMEKHFIWLKFGDVFVERFVAVCRWRWGWHAQRQHHGWNGWTYGRSDRRRQRELCKSQPWRYSSNY